MQIPILRRLLTIIRRKEEVTWAYALILTAFALTIPGSRGQETLFTQADALAIARAVNTAEVEFLVRSKHAVDLQSRSHRFIQKLQSEIEIEWGANPNSFSAKGYDVRLALTNDQTQYTLTIVPKLEQQKSGACLPIYVTNESGQIYQGFPSWCESTGSGQ